VEIISSSVGRKVAFGVEFMGFDINARRCNGGSNLGCSESEAYQMSLWVRAIVFNATFNSISAISWRSVFLAKTGVHGENHGPAVSH